jgi:hypothetical protein
MTTIPTSKGDLEAALGAQFRDTRRANQVWLRDLSKKLGVSVNTVRWHEAGARMMRTDLIVRAAEIIGVPASELVVLKREPDTQEKEQDDAST